MNTYSRKSPRKELGVEEGLRMTTSDVILDIGDFLVTCRVKIVSNREDQRVDIESYRKGCTYRTENSSLGSRSSTDNIYDTFYVCFVCGRVGRCTCVTRNYRREGQKRIKNYLEHHLLDYS